MGACVHGLSVLGPHRAAAVPVNSYAHPVMSASHCSLGVTPHLWLSQSPRLLFHRDPVSVHCSPPHSGLWQIQGKVASPVLPCGDAKHKAFTMSPVTKVRLQDKTPPVKQRSQEQSSGLDGSGRKWGSETSPERHQPWHASKAKSGLRVPATMVYSLPAAG